MRSDVLEVIWSARDVTNAIVLTHNIDFVFLQTVVMSAFGRCGSPKVTIFADSGCATETFAQQRAVLTDLGARYRVVPVAMDAGFRFHPKAVLLTGETTGTLLVGSGNLTFGGWRENAEIWTRFDSKNDGPGSLHAFRGYLADVLKRVVLPEAVEREVAEAFDASTKPWLSDGEADGALVGRVGNGPPLLEQMLAVGGNEPVEELVVCAPYFDHQGLALQEFAADVRANRTTVLCQPGRTGLHRQAWERNAANATLQSIDYRHRGSAESERSAFVHAKFYGLRRDDEVVVLAGSANCSRAALTVRGNAGNAELMAVRRVTPKAFAEELVGELDRLPGPVSLPDDPLDETDADAATSALRVLAARFDAGRLLIGYAPSSAMVAECVVNEAAVPFERAAKGVVSVPRPPEPKSVVVRAWVDEVLIESAAAWVDIEHKLRATAHSRSLADSFRARVQAGAWSADGWADVLNVFCKHLAYLPDVGPGGAAERTDGRDDEPDGSTYTEADVFAPDYRPPKLERVWFQAGDDGHGQVHSLRQLLLRWFGVAGDEPETAPDAHEDSDHPGGEETVDRPEQLPTVPPLETSQMILNQRRIARIVDQLQRAMTSSQFLEGRSPEYLSTDLKVASVLLGVGLAKGWLERERFFELTHSIWSSLFFARGRDEDGWLEYRANTAEHREAFVGSMRSAELSAALIGWYLAALRPGSGTPEAARFTLAAVLAVGRLPWLWHGGGQEDIGKELAVLLAHTAEAGRLDHEERVRSAEVEWKRLIQRGEALHRLELAVGNATLDAIRERVRIDELVPGDVLWQGAAGFCVVLRRCSRSAKDNVPVLKLQGRDTPVEFQASATVPMRALLDEEVIERTQDFRRRSAQSPPRFHRRTVDRDRIRDDEIQAANRVLGRVRTTRHRAIWCRPCCENRRVVCAGTRLENKAWASHGA